MKDTAPSTGLRHLRQSGRPLRAFQVYGERCSGTNFVIKTLQASFEHDAFTEHWGFKHWFVPPHVAIPPGVGVLIVARDPFDWVRSLHANPWHATPRLKGLPLGAFLRSEWRCVWEPPYWEVTDDHPLAGTEMLHERDPATGQPFANPLRLRAAKLRHWADLTERAPDVACIPYEAARDAPEDVFGALGSMLGREGAVDPVRSYKGLNEELYRGSTYPPLTPADRAFVVDQLDWSVEALWGYTPDHDTSRR